ncbi:cytochrome P450 [Paraphoma chrysanthemicola]|nr:cytochrome P450 [Paraphoma chrysanthemicola]
MWLIVFTSFATCFSFAISALYTKLTSRTKHATIGQLPPLAPTWIPFLGHSLELLLHPYEFARAIDPNKPARLRLPGVNPILVQGKMNVRQLFKLSSQSNPAHAQQFIASHLFGMPAEASASFVRDTSGISPKPRTRSNIEARNRICFRDHEIIHRTFQGHGLIGLVETFSRLLHNTVNKMPVGCQWVAIPDLFGFLTAQITPLTVEVLCGPVLVKLIDPEFVQNFWKFDSWAPMITKKAPRWLFPAGYRVRDKLLDSIIRWREFTSSCEGTNEENIGCKGMMDKIKLLDVDGWSIEAVAASDLGLIWAANSNTISCLYWMLYELCRDPSLMTIVRDEFERSLQQPTHPSTSGFDLPVLLKQPYLQAVFAETLRLRNHIFITRYPDPHDMLVNGWRLPAKSMVMTCSTVQHMNEDLWSTGHNRSHPLDTFWAGRFLSSPSDASTISKERRDSAMSLEPSDQPRTKDFGQATSGIEFSTKGLEGAWIPFGGGTQMCPGQKLAKTEIFLAAALVLTRFEIILDDPSVEMAVNWGHFGTGVARPAAKLPFRMRRRC